MGEELVTTAMIDGQNMAADVLPVEPTNGEIYDAMADIADSTDELSGLAKVIAGFSIVGGIGGLFGIGYGIKKLTDWIRNRGDDDEEEEDEKPRRKKKGKKKPVVKGKATKKSKQQDEDLDDEEDEESEEE